MGAIGLINFVNFLALIGIKIKDCRNRKKKLKMKISS